MFGGAGYFTTGGFDGSTSNRFVVSANCHLRFKSGSVTFWAWVVSIAVHLIMLLGFGFLKFSHSKPEIRDILIPTAQVSRVRKLIRATPIIPKPKIKRSYRKHLTSRLNTIEHRLSVEQIFKTSKPTAKSFGTLTRPVHSQSGLSLPSSAILPKKIEFFGSFTDERKVCYVVDCSGSMHGVFGRVRRELKESIKSLQADQYFYIIFFGGDKLFESGNGRLFRATEQAKSSAYDFIESVQPAGRTNALAALERAEQIRDSGGVNPSTIYFLTDGFELTTEDAQQLLQKVAGLLLQFGPATRINTIGFWPQSDDRKMLEAIARQSGGEFILITD